MLFIAKAIPDIFFIEPRAHGGKFDYLVEIFGLEIVTTELYHYSNEGVCSWYDFAKTIFELSNIDNVSAIETKDYPTPAMRPHYSLLNKAKIKQQFAMAIPYWKDSLQVCLSQLAEQEPH